jgi:pimeloyl-ACP methyl ester carboxylesterase
MGKTPRTDWIANNDDVLAIVQSFIDKVIPGQRFAVAGYSYGGYLARGIVHRESAMINGLLLIAPIIAPNKLCLSTKPALVKDDALVLELTKEELSVFNLAVVQSREALEYLRIYVLPAIRVADLEFVKRLEGKFSFDVDNLSEPFNKPTLILMGRQDSYVGYRDSWGIIENYPRATFAVLDRSGHFVGRPGEQENLFVALVNEWIDRVEDCADK